MEEIEMAELSREDMLFLDKMIALGSSLDMAGHWKRSFYDNWV